LATQEQINAIDSAITDLTNSYGDEFVAGWNSFLIAWSQLSDPYDRVAVFGLLTELRNSLANNINASDAVSVAIIQLNGGATGLQGPVADLKNTAYNQNNIELETAVNTVMLLILAAGIVAAGSVILSQQNNDAILRRIKRLFDSSIISIVSSITKTMGTAQSKYKYVGGIILTTRPFCNSHNGKVYSQTEITNIWSGSWEGKAPGDPFAVRGGYNCRHFWILEK
jgi:hypothetical protein